MTKQNTLITDLVFEQLLPVHFPLAKQFYKQARYHSHVGRNDEVYVVRNQAQHNVIIAAVRLVRLGEHLVLRSMVVANHMQRSGVGHFLLENLETSINQRVCWCFPFEWLDSFYRLGGFSPCDLSQSPHEIRHKFEQYTSQGKKLLIMKRQQD